MAGAVGSFGSFRSSAEPPTGVRRDASPNPVAAQGPELLGRAGNADVFLLSRRIGDRAAGLAVRGLLGRRIAGNADVFLLSRRIGVRAAGLAVRGLRWRRIARNADVFLL